MAHFPFYVGTLPPLCPSSLASPALFPNDSSITADRRETRDVRGHLTGRLDLSTRYTSQIEVDGMILAAASEARRS